MAEYLNAKCSICGSKYHICDDCSKITGFTPWRTVTCSKECYKIYMALNAYTKRQASRAETCQLLKKLNLSNLATFEANIRSSIEELLENDNP